MKAMFQNIRNKEVFVNKGSKLVIPALFITLIGCGRCEECTENSSTETICEAEFDSVQQYEDAIADRESDGASCTASGGF